MCELSVKAPCQNLPHKLVPSLFISHSSHLPPPRQLSAQIVLLINYAIIPIRWLIAGSSSTFLLQISSLTTLAATGQAEISDAACSCVMLQLQSDATDLRQAASLPTSDWPPGTTRSVVSSYGFIRKSRSRFAAPYLHRTVTLVWSGQDLTSVQLRCQDMPEDVGRSKARAQHL